MALVAFMSKKDGGKIVYAFDSEPERYPDSEEYIALPPCPTVVPATVAFMADAPLLDSFSTLDELDHIMGMEAAMERETAEYQAQIIEK